MEQTEEELEMKGSEFRSTSGFKNERICDCLRKSRKRKADTSVAKLRNLQGQANEAKQHETTAEKRKLRSAVSVRVNPHL